MGARSELTQLLAVYWSLLLGNIVEWYEFAIYGHLAIYMEKHFFQGSAVGVWLGFSLTFVCRPLGGIILGVIGDRFGRSVAVNISIIGMLIGTCGQGCLPTLDCGIPWLGNLGLVMLVLLRCLQGLSAAGEIVTITSYLTEVASPSILSRGAALVNITGSCGFLLAKFVSFAVEAIFGAEAVDAWAWRLPFLLAIVPGMIAVVGRRGIPESGMFLESQANDSKMAAESSLAKVMRAFKYWPNMLVCFGVVATFGVLQYGCLVWIHMFLAQQGMSADDRMVVGLITRCLMICLGLPIGWLSDKIGVGWLMTLTSAAVMVCGLPLWAVIASNPTDLMAVALAFGVGFGLLASFSGTLLYHFIVELFPTEVRTTGMGLSYNLGFSLFGGLSPVTVTLLYKATWLGPGILYTIAGGIGLLTMVVARSLMASGHLEIAYVRTHPYFGRCSTGPEDVELHEGHRRAEEKKVAGKIDEEIGFGGNPIKPDKLAASTRA